MSDKAVLTCLAEAKRARDFLKAEREDTVEAWRAFLKDYPDDTEGKKMVRVAERRRDFLEALAENSVESWTKYRERHKDDSEGTDRLEAAKKTLHFSGGMRK